MIEMIEMIEKAIMMGGTNNEATEDFMVKYLTLKIWPSLIEKHRIACLNKGMNP